MALESLGSVLTSNSSTLRSAGLNQDDLLKVLLAQFRYQDPLKPLDNQEFISQLVQFTSLEQSRQANDKLDSLLGIQNGTQAIGLLGRTVEVTSNGQSAVGQVTATRFQQGAPVLTVQLTNGTTLTDVTLGEISLVR